MEPLTDAIPESPDDVAPPRAGAVAILVLLPILALGAALRIPHLDSFGYGVDEGNTIMESVDLVEKYDWRFWKIERRKLWPLSASMPLSYYLAAAGLEWIGRDFTGMRIPFLALGILSLYLTWALARRVGGSLLAAALAALFLAVNAAHVEYSQFARFYVPTLVVCLLFALALLRTVRDPGVLSGALLAAATALGYLTHHLFPLVLPFAALYLAIAFLHPKEVGRPGYRTSLVLVVALALLVSSAPLIVNVSELLSKGYLQARTGDDRPLSDTIANVVRAGGGGLLRIEPPLVLLALVGAWTAIRERGRHGFLLVLLAFGLAAGILASSLVGEIRGRYLIWCLPFFCVLAAFATDHLFRTRGWLAGGLVALITLLWLGHGTVLYHSHGDGRVAAARVRPEAEAAAAGDPVMILGWGPRDGALAVEGWDMEKTSRIPTPDLGGLRDTLEGLTEGRHVIVSHQMLEGFIEKAGLLEDPRLRLLSVIPERTRRRASYYAIYEWRPDR